MASKGLITRTTTLITAGVADTDVTTRAAVRLKFLIAINRTGTRNTSLWHRIAV